MIRFFFLQHVLFSQMAFTSTAFAVHKVTMSIRIRTLTELVVVTMVQLNIVLSIVYLAVVVITMVELRM